MLKRLLRKKSTSLALCWALGILFMALAAPIFLSGKAQHMDFSHVLQAPSLEHVFGTDSLGRDLFCRVICGSRVSLGVGVVAVSLALFIGTLIGALAGYYGGWRDRALMALVDMMLCFPTFFLILAVIAILGPSVFNIMLIIGVTSWMGTARLIRAQILSLKEREFILAARALGAGDGYIILKHLIPNAAGPVIVNAILGISVAILVESGLSFLGIGGPAADAQLGQYTFGWESDLGSGVVADAFPRHDDFFDSAFN